MGDGVEVLTVYAFSSENWRRDALEVDTLMRIFAKYAESFCKEAQTRNVRVEVLSTDLQRLPVAVRASVESLVAATRHCAGFTFNICLSYGGREGESYSPLVAGVTLTGPACCRNPRGVQQSGQRGDTGGHSAGARH